MKKLFKILPVIFFAGLIKVYGMDAPPLKPAPIWNTKELTLVFQDTLTNKARAKKGTREVGNGAKEMGKGTKDLAVSGAKATGKGAKKAGKAVKRTADKGAKKAENAVD